MKYKTCGQLYLIVAMLAVFIGNAPASGTASPREKLSLDDGWKFHLGDDWGLGENLAKAGESDGPANENFDDSSWRTVNLPHDWVVELPFDSQANYDHGYKPAGPGYPTNSVGWYRRAFTLQKTDQGKKLWLEFAGVYRDCRIFLNGFLLDHHISGYNSFRCDITDVAKYDGENVLTVRVDASQFEGWFYEGAGIYRHVWLVKTAPLAIAPDGIFVYSSFKNNVPQGAATIHFETQLLNSKPESTEARVTWQIFNPEGQIAGGSSASEKLNPLAGTKAVQSVMISDPELWSPESPKLYQLITTVESGGEVIDRETTEFGIRTVAFDVTNGFLLNGKHYEIQGTCNHQDAAGVGSAMPDAMQYFRIKQLKAMGCNAYRTSHNEPAAELLDACDHLGMLVMDENRRFGIDPQNLADLKQQILRDRNHPGVFIWSLANEEHSYQQSAVGARIFETMQNLVHQLDPTRLCTAAMDGRSAGKADGFSSVMDVQGFNYIHRGDMDKFHEANPGIPCIGTEEASVYYTRGIYENTKTYESAYDGNKPDYGTTAEEWWNYYSARPWASGSFVWTGFDYRGEESPFHWPNISSEFGMLDTCGFPKDVYYYYQSWWTDKPVLHLMPHWNWPGKAGQDIDVRCFSNCQEVELFLNGHSLGRKTMQKNSHLQWPVKYEPGILSAEGYNGGKLVAETKVETTGEPAAIQLSPDRPVITADGKDLSMVAVAVTDGQGRVVPVAGNLIHFTLDGPGKIIGVGNGDPASHEPDVYLTQYPAHLQAFNESWRYKEVPDVRHDQSEYKVNYDDSSWETTDVQSAGAQLSEHTQAVFRTRFQVSETDLTAGAVKLDFELIDDDGFIYVNGQRVGDAHVREMPAVFDIKPFLHPGENTLAVGVSNDGGPGGISRGVTLTYQYQSIPPHWQRSVFNGLAQVIVQSSDKPGVIKLTATADGLAPATMLIHTKSPAPQDQP